MRERDKSRIGDRPRPVGFRLGGLGAAPPPFLRGEGRFGDPPVPSCLAASVRTGCEREDDECDEERRRLRERRPALRSGRSECGPRGGALRASSMTPRSDGGCPLLVDASLVSTVPPADRLDRRLRLRTPDVPRVSFSMGRASSVKRQPPRGRGEDSAGPSAHLWIAP